MIHICVESQTYEKIAYITAQKRIFRRDLLLKILDIYIKENHKEKPFDNDESSISISIPIEEGVDKKLYKESAKKITNEDINKILDKMLFQENGDK